jgi:hypothetical protein
MGADVYLESVHNKTREKWERKFNAAVAKRDQSVEGSALAKEYQKEVSEAYDKMFSEGYFRDCYNGYGLFVNLSSRLSWWRDVVPMLDGGYLPLDKAAELRQEVINATIDLTSANAVAKRQQDQPPKIEDYEKFRQELVNILDLSLKLGEPLYMSL